jgi:hypothetical protein
MYIITESIEAGILLGQHDDGLAARGLDLLGEPPQLGLHDLPQLEAAPHAPAPSARVELHAEDRQDPLQIEIADTAAHFADHHQPRLDIELLRLADKPGPPLDDELLARIKEPARLGAQSLQLDVVGLQPATTALLPLRAAPLVSVGLEAVLLEVLDEVALRLALPGHAREPPLIGLAGELVRVLGELAGEDALDRIRRRGQGFARRRRPLRGERLRGEEEAEGNAQGKKK